MSDNKYNNIMHLGNPTNTIAVLNRYGFDFKKKFGQNFLIDEMLLRKSYVKQALRKTISLLKSALESEQ